MMMKTKPLDNYYFWLGDDGEIEKLDRSDFFKKVEEIKKQYKKEENSVH